MMKYLLNLEVPIAGAPDVDKAKADVDSINVPTLTKKSTTIACITRPRIAITTHNHKKANSRYQTFILFKETWISRQTQRSKQPLLGY